PKVCTQYNTQCLQTPSIGNGKYFYRFESGSGRQFINSVGSNTFTTTSTTAWLSNPYQKAESGAWNFTGVTNATARPWTPSSLKPFTIAMWVNITSNGVIFCYAQGDCGTNYGIILFAGTTGANGPAYATDWALLNSGVAWHDCGNVFPTDKLWHYIVFSIDGSNNWNLYQDNVNVCSFTEAPTSGTQNLFTLGAAWYNVCSCNINSNLGRYSIDNLRFYNFAVTSLQEQQLYFFESGNNSPPQVIGIASKTGQTGTLATLLVRTSVSTNSIYQVGCDLDVTVFVSGTINCQITYTDWNSGAQTITIDSATALGDFLGGSDTLMSKASTSITCKTTGTFTATYNVACYIIFLGS
ncbi:MAG TPA: hypothetical protein VEP90_15025, partial [Methylomirabilota bacterium]|nr:hypothetical protein [Methylomirabilota bacterium]